MGQATSTEDLLQKLSGMSSLPDRLDALLSIGLTVSDLAEVASTSEQTIQNWLRGTRPTKGERAIDNLRLATVIGLQRGHAPDAMANWLKSGNPNLEDFSSPLELIDHNRLDVIRALGAEPVPEDAPGGLTKEDERRLLTG